MACLDVRMDCTVLCPSPIRDELVSGRSSPRSDRSEKNTPSATVVAMNAPLVSFFRCWPLTALTFNLVPIPLNAVLSILIRHRILYKRKQ